MNRCIGSGNEKVPSLERIGNYQQEDKDFEVKQDQVYFCHISAYLVGDCIVSFFRAISRWLFTRALKRRYQPKDNCCASGSQCRSLRTGVARHFRVCPPPPRKRTVQSELNFNQLLKQRTLLNNVLLAKMCRIGLQSQIVPVIW